MSVWTTRLPVNLAPVCGGGFTSKPRSRTERLCLRAMRSRTSHAPSDDAALACSRTSDTRSRLGTKKPRSLRCGAGDHLASDLTVLSTASASHSALSNRSNVAPIGMPSFVAAALIDCSASTAPSF